MKKILISFICLLFSVTASQAAVQMKVAALDSFKTDSPAESMDVMVLQDTVLGENDIAVNSTLHCRVLKIVDPKRGKRKATFFVKPLSYTTKDGVTNDIEGDYYGKYSTFVLSKEELKEIPPGKVIKSAALSVGNYFVKGLSTGVAFVQGFAKNKEHNRLKSGVVNAYEESPLSYISEGQQLDIKVGDDFYLVFKTEEDEAEDSTVSDTTSDSAKTTDEPQNSDSVKESAETSDNEAAVN